LLADARNRLNAYCEAVNEPIGASGENPCTAYGRLLNAQTSLNGLDLPALPLEGAVDWNGEDVARRAQLVAQLQERVIRSGIPIRHPFWGSRLKILLPTDRDEIRKLTIGAAVACADLVQAASALARSFSAEPPQTDRAVETLCRSARHVLAAPDLGGVVLSSPEWLSQEQPIRQALAAGARDRDLHRQYGAGLRAEAWGTDTSELRRSVAELGGRWWRLLSSRWRHAKKSLAALCTSAPPPDRTSQLALLDALAESAQCARTIAGAGDSMARLFTASWKSADSDWDLLATQAEWVGDVDMHMVNRTQLADLLAQVVRVESPVHWTEAARRVLSGAGVQRFGTRIQQAIEEAVKLGISRGLFLKRGEFLWGTAMQQPPVRDRSALPAASRKLEFVPPEELRRAILLVVQESYGIVPGEVPNAVCRLFGFSRVTDDMSAAVEPHRDALVREGYLALQGVNLVLATPKNA
jgi:hypothetical protein